MIIQKIIVIITRDYLYNNLIVKIIKFLIMASKLFICNDLNAVGILYHDYHVVLMNIIEGIEILQHRYNRFLI